MSQHNTAQAAAKKAAWVALDGAARDHAGVGSAVTAQRLAEAACEWARAKGYREPRSESEESSEARLPNYGRNKGQIVSEVETKDLSWYAKTLRESLDNPEKARWAAQNQAHLDAIEGELERRG